MNLVSHRKMTDEMIDPIETVFWKVTTDVKERDTSLRHTGDQGTSLASKAQSYNVRVQTGAGNEVSCLILLISDIGQPRHQ